MKSGILLLLGLPIVLGAWGEPTVKLCLDGSVSCGETGIRFLPTVADKGWARTSLRLEDPARCTVYGLDAAGRRIERLPAMVDDGQLVFTASVRGPKGARICYEIVR